jgi:SAM-dependent methyltransferase
MKKVVYNQEVTESSPAAGRAGGGSLAVLIAALTALASTGGIATAQTLQDVPAELKPLYGTASKDSGYIPTPATLVERMLSMARVGPDDLLVDLGSGDGRIPLLAAQRFGARALGIELIPELVAYSRREADRLGLGERVRFVQGDIFATDFSQATVVALYLPPSVNLRLRPLILAMKPGTRVVSHNFGFGDWKPDHGDASDDAYGWLWIVPAAAAGRWQIELPAQSGIDARRFEFQLRQRFQQLQGEVHINTQPAQLFSSELRGDQLSLSVMNRATHWTDFKGRLDGDRYEGEYRDASGAQGRFVARRVGQ